MSFNPPFVHRFQAMTVPCEVQLYHSEKAADIAALIESNTLRLEQKFNFYDSHSWLNQQLNQRQSSSVVLDDESYAVFEVLKRLVDGTKGVFDPTVGTVKSMMASTPQLDRNAAYEGAKAFMGVDAWSLSDKTLSIPHAETQFDLGGVIKEFAVDQAVMIAETFGVSSALVNFGGDIRALGTKPDGSPFNVAVLNPKNKHEPFFSLPLADAALTTSAHYERSFQFGDEESSHILSQRGTHPQVLSVSVLAPTTLEAGALSTALTLEPTLPVPEQVGVVFIDDQLAIHQDTEFVA
ncbi:FAD:protein FMN transferase [Vibrio coralliilyticus]|uniref:FAD:protein FMN transferase n=1 Tax=Vibrio coralliilyticus TaxID=190893 RepID=UPI0006CC2119|nr:FAD:protein FMN transferase [Vibrio coralliilyticus]AXN34114.1 FAD:protein FMN transferase [Vibrio coralliilyticus]KPH24348.1 thiamine biosynthesis protein ApbE [Vibrio coralliilyticus]